ncbi:hypothetical protein [Sphingomonas sp. RS2018]
MTDDAAVRTERSGRDAVAPASRVGMRIMGLLCFVFGHDYRRPVDERRGKANFKVCKRCRRVMTRDYYDGWKKATGTERDYYLHIADTIASRSEQMRAHGDDALAPEMVASPAGVVTARL